jgi:excisionase family DNA binding protein
MTAHAVAVSIVDAAACLALSRSTVYRLIAIGKLRAFSVGSRRLIAVTELERFAERQTTVQNARPVPPAVRKAAG